LIPKPDFVGHEKCRKSKGENQFRLCARNRLLEKCRVTPYARSVSHLLIEHIDASSPVKGTSDFP
jgi:hypothetical protein